MEAVQEVLAVLKENWPVLKDVLAVVGGAATVLGSLLTISGMKRRWRDSREAKRRDRDFRAALARQNARDRAEWFSYVYRQKNHVWNTQGMDKLTVQQVCGMIGEDLPEWAIDGWERVVMEDLNRRVWKV